MIEATIFFLTEHHPDTTLHTYINLITSKIQNINKI
jgi:hypothetical protein